VGRLRLSPAAFRRIAFLAGVLLAVIIVTGGAVRLTGSGLGCPDWPSCRPDSLVPHGVSDSHAMVEFVNRTFTGAVSIAVIVCVLGALLRAPRRRDLTWASLGLVVGVIAQAVLGGLTVLFELKPQFVMAHFLLSLALVTDAVFLYRRAGDAGVNPRSIVTPSVRRAGWLLTVWAGVVVFAGTIVTSSGPHGGDRKAKRFGFSVSSVARVHGIAVTLFLLMALASFWLLRRTRAPEPVLSRLGAVFVIACLQTVIGYVQYFNDTPVLLVGFHIAGATALWVAVIWYLLGLTERDPEPSLVGDLDRATAR